MTLLATHLHRRPASHAFTTPVVREVAPAGQGVVAGSAW
jgi:hypothetical protein